ncbi:MULTISPECIES: DUF1127 domain-containing protein [Halocynthiibacter]|uniref:DUF1127 domain-containing protein n=1 Tax=Halocynthiibacter halioticoli TaxID=2986804 RepID=A0AAE3J1E0_9RHOB|nr:MULTISPECIES: DUF1127 domain-containing protein [Halocynthiibacter]MCV6824766.1 DUF1127 domain-containing protein [Halocynthiibacter halioticoli]MCW4057767.1 DUF1127 domain-containing protein [Halocynthiibacter sp. SDUM655004]MDE0589193.1 DUF1127 domain-containing protein [Halocynthiibacter sp. C4]
MAFATDIRAAEAGIQVRITAAYKALVEKFAQYKTYRNTLNELEALSARELADLGLNRSMIKRVALEAAYGA